MQTILRGRVARVVCVAVALTVGLGSTARAQTTEPVAVSGAEDGPIRAAVSAFLVKDFSNQGRIRSGFPAQAGNPAVQDDDGLPIHVALAGMFAASVADTAITYHLLTLHPGYIEETNPALEYLENKPRALVAVKTGISVLLTYTLLQLHKERPRQAFWIATLAAGFYTWAAVHNWQYNHPLPTPD